MKPLAEICAPAVATERILFAFTTREQALFLPGLRWEEFGDHVCSYIDTDAAGPEGWARMLCEWRPTVVVTAWSAKRLPADWVMSPEFSLKYICHITGSLKSLLTREAFLRGVRATNWGSSINHTIAEHAMLMTLALLRGAGSWPEAMQRGGWTVDQVRRLRTRALRGRRVGLHGFGAIAREIATMLAPFKPAVIRAYSHGVPPAFMAGHGVEPCRSLDELYGSSEVMICCESLTAENRASVDARVLRLLEDDAIFVNVGRGEIVSEDALLAEAATGRLRIGLDVFHREPMPVDYPLRTAPGIMLSPHIAGPTLETYPLCGEHALENLRRYLAGESLSGEVTLDAFDRMT
ncbi:hydroxyacid dehydrogenase [Rariglobus hedericola]|uniref:Hydroxyacid dehydrogenase n=1 Tax=Rariglobus hedericola TaxID=2597822 RepID=A0A556QSC4_9BACT|nr:hydroxyacid dehydrogenase [Rariglobus hedericola]TSJ79540.1 hydroxyacid dehydrogenase [Rariglobus hedericola]